ncbi:MAG TPA: tetratricopeptide repeat protein [Pyrinomonadaceae bacterium]|nr:tetratricopeptide repeat protein [Pyrinomonadaceae bacterium]
MAFDKVKTLRAAERCLELGKIPAAVKEYCKIVEDDPDDFTTLNMLGDLYTRVGNQPAAIACFRRIAEHYREQDFALKAIAMFKKIDRLQPHNTEISTHLADLYAQQDLVVEARAHYLAVADAHNKAGATQAGLEVLRKIADLDSQNTELRIKLAEGYFKEGMMAEAGTAFAEAGHQLLARGAFDEALDVFGKALERRPADHVVLRGLLDAHSVRGTADEAAELIGHAVADHPDDLDLLSMLARAHVQAEDPSQAEQATAILVAKESSAYLQYVEVARLYLKTDQVDEAVRVMTGIAEQMLAEQEDNQLLELIDELLACDSDNVQALRLLVRAYWWQRDMEKLNAALERMAEAAEAAGLVKDERYALTQLTRLAPEQAHHVERLRELGGAEEEAAAEILPVIESASASSEAPTASKTDDVYAFDPPPSNPVGESEFEWSPVEDMAELKSESGNEFEIERGFSFETVVAEELASTSDEAMATPSSDDRVKDARTQELESVDFYIAQGYADIAVDTLDLLERQFGAHPDIERRRGQVATMGEVPTAMPDDSDISIDAAIATQAEAEFGEFEFATAGAFATPEVAVPMQHVAQVSLPAPQRTQGIDAGLAEIFEEHRVSAESDTDANGNGDYETHYNLGLAYKEMDLFEEALEEFQVAAGLVDPGDGTPRYLQCCNLLGHCFMQKGVPQLAVKWFNKGFNSPGASEDERQALRYELAAAFEQVGDVDRAIDLFTEVYGINVSYRGVKDRLRELKARANGENGKAAPALERNKNHEQHVN